MARLKEDLVALLEEIPGVTHEDWPDRDDGFSTILFDGKEIGHFHHWGELDLALGAKLIKREGLKHPPDSTVHPKRSPNSRYIELRFDRAAELDEIVRLVRLLVESLK